MTSIGTLKFKLHDGTGKLLDEFRYVSNLKRNLISFDKIEEKEYVCKCEKKVMKMIRGSMVMIKGMRKNYLHALKATIVFGPTPTTKQIALFKTN